MTGSSSPSSSSCNANGSGTSYVQKMVGELGWPSGVMSGGRRHKRSAKRGKRTAKRGKRSAKRGKRSAKRGKRSMKGGKCGCAMTGGKKSRKHRRRGKKGGFMSVIKEAIVPFTLYKLQKRSQRKK